MATYFTAQRHHTIPWLIFHAKDLKEKSLRLHDVSKALYSCFELRNALELFEVKVLLASVPNDYRFEILEISRNKNGIEKANKEFNGLKYKFQRFYEIVCKISNHRGTPYDYYKSNALKDKLSQYLHTYWKQEEDMTFTSDFIQSAFPLIEETILFINSSLLTDKNGNKEIQSLDFEVLSQERKNVLQEWRLGTIKTEEELIEKLKNTN